MQLVPFQVALVLSPRVGGFGYVLRLCGPFKQSFLKVPQFFCHPNPHWFLQPEVTGIYLPSVGTGLGLGSLAPKVSLLIFTHHTWMWHCPCPICSHLSVPHLISSPLPHLRPLLRVWMNVASLNPWLLNLHTVWFSDSSGCYLFWDLVVILFVVVQGGEECLPTPLSCP